MATQVDIAAKFATVHQNPISSAETEKPRTLSMGSNWGQLAPLYLGDVHPHVPVEYKVELLPMPTTRKRAWCVGTGGRAKAWCLLIHIQAVRSPVLEETGG
jgi:hypothetical protein